jgi:PTH1 family peptidyl-tRNA hydrolase
VFIIIGLGNPGSEYKNTRHNTGFLVLDKIANQRNLNFVGGKGPYLETTFRIKRNTVLLIKPTTFMNLSGIAVRSVFDFYKLSDYSKSLIILDDIHLPLGLMRLRPKGSHGGQKGLKSILTHLGSQDIPRLRIGIGNHFTDPVKYVLSPFRKVEQSDLTIILQWAVEAVESFVINGIDVSMNRYNRNVLIN